jgi:hypothetical protein
VTDSGRPDEALKLPDKRQLDATARGSALLNSGDCTVALIVKICRRSLSHGP